MKCMLFLIVFATLVVAEMQVLEDTCEYSIPCYQLLLNTEDGNIYRKLSWKDEPIFEETHAARLKREKDTEDGEAFRKSLAPWDILGYDYEGLGCLIVLSAVDHNVYKQYPHKLVYMEPLATYQARKDEEVRLIKEEQARQDQAQRESMRILGHAAHLRNREMTSFVIMGFDYEYEYDGRNATEALAVARDWLYPVWYREDPVRPIWYHDSIQPLITVRWEAFGQWLHYDQIKIRADYGRDHRFYYIECREDYCQDLYDKLGRIASHMSRQDAH